MSHGKSSFVYVTYIRTTPDKLWAALTDKKFSRQFWLGAVVESDWKVGSPWRMVHDGGVLSDEGEIVEAARPRRLVLRWRHKLSEEAAREGEALCVIEIEPLEGAVKLTVDHSIAVANSKLVAAVSGGWPMILSNLKSILETDRVLLPNFNVQG